MDTEPSLFRRVHQEETTKGPECLAAQPGGWLLFEENYSPAGVGELGGRDQAGQTCPYDNDIDLTGHPIHTVQRPALSIGTWAGSVETLCPRPRFVHWMGILRVAAVVGVGVVTAGCAATASLKPGPAATTPVPWISETPKYVPPTPASTVIPAGTPSCTAESLVAAYAGSGAMTGGQLMGTIRLGNHSGAACFLEGFPGIQLYDSAGHPISVHIYTWTDPKPDQILIQPGTDNLAGDSEPTGAAWVGMIWPTHDPATGSCSPPAAQGTMVVLGLPSGGGSLRVPVTGGLNGGYIASCGGSLSVGPFEAIPAPAATPPPARFSIELDTPVSVVAGQTLHYVVRLRNITSAPIAFDRPCPTYGEWGAGTKNFYVLNCGGVPPIQPDQSVSFAMELQIPSSVGPGPFTIFWNLTGPDMLNQMPGKATIQVTR